MTAAKLPLRRADRVFVGLVIGFAVVLLLFGGASRYDEIAQVPVRLAALGLLAAASFRSPEAAPSEVKWPAAVLVGALALVALQLVPLPPALWSALPGRTLLLQAAAAQGAGQPWRPLALAPDLAVNALLSLLVPTATLYALAVLPRAEQRWLGPTILAAIAFSMLAGGLQLITGAKGFSWVYRVLFDGWAPGVFTNRNHQALLLGIAPPLTAALPRLRAPDRSGTIARLAIWIGAPIYLLVLLATGSRAGLVLAAIGLLAAGAITFTERGPAMRAPARTNKRLALLVGALVLVVPLVAAAMFSGKAPAIDRTFEANPFEDKRARVFPTLLQMLRSYFPAGIGFGSFDPAFRISESNDLLGPTYLNQAHSDLLQVLLEGGAPGAALLLSALAWLAWASFRIWKSPRGGEGKAASAALWLMVLASAVDYPLRTPLMMAVGMALTFQLCLSLAAVRRRPGQQSPHDCPLRVSGSNL